MFKHIITAIIIVCCLFPSVNAANVKDGDDLYKNTLSFLGLLAYGERKQDIGLRFSWRQSGDKWVPAGNGFVFLSEGLGVYDYKDCQNSCVNFNKDELWHVDQNLDYIKTDTILKNADIVKFISMDEHSTADTAAASLYVELKSMKTEADSIVPATLTWSGQTEFPRDSIEFMCFLDKTEGAIYLSFMNLLPYNITTYIDNTPYPASRIGVRSFSAVQIGDESQEPEISDIIMDGRIILPPYSFSLFKFAIELI